MAFGSKMARARLNGVTDFCGFTVRMWGIVTLLGAFVVAIPARAVQPSASQAASSQPTATQPSGDSDAPLTSGDAEVDRILDRLEARGKSVDDLTAHVRKDHVDTIPVDEVRTSEGLLRFRRFEPNPRFYVRFDKFIEAGIVRDKERDRQYFAFDGQWLIERNNKTKRVIMREVVNKGETVNPFKIGQGPFPLPFGQKRDDLLKTFTINRVESKKGDPENSDHLRCVPRPEVDLGEKYTEVHFFIDRKLELPVRIDAYRAKDDAIVRVFFTDIKINTGLPGSDFEIPIDDCAVTKEPLAKR